MTTIPTDERMWRFRAPSRPLGVLLSIGCFACNPEVAVSRFAPDGTDVRARAYLDLVARHQADSVEARLLPALASADARRRIQELDTLLGGEHFETARMIGAQVNTINGVRHVNLSYEHHARMGWLVTNVATVDSAGTWFVEAVHAEGIKRPLEQLNAFSLSDRSFIHYAWLLLTICGAASTLGVAAFIASRRGMPRRWRWALVSLLGVGAFSLNWTTGATEIRLVSVQLFAAAVMRAGPVAPWVLTFALPVGALLALWHYRRWRVASHVPAQSDALRESDLHPAD